ncbi:hypothetical protein H5410_011735 [Solanum commersonii]|uniref:Ycf2 N-terminal domain-containing protein n=1 Tax=Solanum commersonii TaxID=4109 RepID=A0A9J6APG7_SOLCO|nr:hypothetical protein H5410_011735 [Solanum commersonii]
MSAFREKIPIEVEGFFKQQGAGSTIQSNDIEHLGEESARIGFFEERIEREWIWLDNVWLVNKDRFFSKVQNVSSNIQYDSTRSSFVQVRSSSQLKGSSDQSRDHLDSISNEDSEYHTLINQRDSTTKRKDRFFGILPFFKRNERDRIRPIRNAFLDIPQCPAIHGTWSELHLGSNPTERSTRDQKLLKKQQDLSFVPSGDRKRNDPGCDMVPKDEPDMDSSNKISFLNKNPFFDLFHLFHDRNREDTRYTTILHQKRFQKWQIYSLYQ